MEKTPWWRDAVVYEIYVRSFADASGDGTGDLAGIRDRLPYLAELGVDAIWLTPFYPSPMADGGYDVADYRDVDALFGTLADFDDLVADAHAHGLRLMVDIVPNHSSSAHPWFQKALAAPRGSQERERYMFREGGPEGTGGGHGEPNNWMSTFGGPAWTQVPDGQWYLHLFAPEQPDFNWRNPEVREEFLDVLRFWLDRGVDGFRIDVAMGLIKAEGLPDTDPGFTAKSPIWSRPEVHDVYRDWRRVLDSYPGTRVAVGEVWTDSAEDLALYVRPDELHQSFNFAWLEAPGRPRRSARSSTTPSSPSPRRPGCCPTTTSYGTSPAMGRGRSTPGPASRGAVRRCCPCSPFPARHTCTRARNSGFPR